MPIIRFLFTGFTRMKSLLIIMISGILKAVIPFLVTLRIMQCNYSFPSFLFIFFFTAGTRRILISSCLLQLLLQNQLRANLCNVYHRLLVLLHFHTFFFLTTLITFYYFPVLVPLLLLFFLVAITVVVFFRCWVLLWKGIRVVNARDVTVAIAVFSAS